MPKLTFVSQPAGTFDFFLDRKISLTLLLLISVLVIALLIGYCRTPVTQQHIEQVEKAIEISHKVNQTRNLIETATKAVDYLKDDTKKGGGKNDKHANQKRRDVAEKEYNEAKKEFDELRKKPNKTKEEAQILDKLKNKIKALKRKMDFTGENHSQKSKSF